MSTSNGQTTGRARSCGGTGEQQHEEHTGDLRSYHLRIWRQKGPNDKGKLEDFDVKGIPANASFLEMLDILNDDLVRKGQEPIANDSDCREGICGTCSLVINGIPHGGQKGSATCQLHMRHFADGETICIEPWRAKAFPVIRDLVVDRGAFDRIIQSGGYVSCRTGAAQDANCIPIPKHDAELAMDAAACIGCGACAAACKNSSAMLFVAAKVSQLSLLPQGHPERTERALKMVERMDKEGFGNCSNQYECSAVCPKEIDSLFIAKLNREFARSSLISAVGARSEMEE
jgi:succinate dehydrogenase / fumarate reductase, iron-sulfur subunit